MDFLQLILLLVKLVINLLILCMYRWGAKGGFLSIGGSWNLNELKAPDPEIVASGVLVGFFVYTLVVLISSFHRSNEYYKYSLVNLLMNFTGAFMFIAVGGTCLHYWTSYETDMEHKYQPVSQEKQLGIAVGSLSIIMGAAFVVEFVLCFVNFNKEGREEKMR